MTKYWLGWKRPCHYIKGGDLGMPLALLKCEQVEALIRRATRMVVDAVMAGRVPNFPRGSRAEADFYFKTTYLPQRLSLDGYDFLRPILTALDDWGAIQDLVPILTDPYDQRIVINALAYLESWQRLNYPPPRSTTLFVLQNSSHK